MTLKFKNCKILEPKIDDQGIIEAFVSIFGNVDAYNEVVDYGAFTESLAKKLPKGVWSHDWSQPIAATLAAREVPAGDPLLPESIKNFGGLYIKGKLVLRVQKAAEALELIKEKVIDEFSIGYNEEEDYTEKDGTRHLKKLQLYEWSPVLVGANPLSELIGVKSVVPYADHGVAPEDTEWDGPAQMAACGDDFEKLKSICAWFDSEAPDVKASYKLPHHQAEGMKAVWKGVAAAMGALLGGRGGVDIPENERRGVYNHLAKHYAEFEKESPEFKFKQEGYSEAELEKIGSGTFGEKPAPEDTGNYIIIRVKDPGYFDPDSFRTIDVSADKGIKATIGCKKGEFTNGTCGVGTEIQRYLFDKDKWTTEEAQAWADKNKGVKEADEAIGTLSKANIETIKSAIRTLTGVLDEHEKRIKGQIPRGSGRKYPVSVLNAAIRQLLKTRKVLS